MNVDIQDNALVVEGSTVVEADVEASNGVIHVIDEVILQSTDRRNTLSLNKV
ncbi:fasciclin domain-containing protein [Marinobacter nauticus]|uniref:fasciclin domain-containing protein n=1 Tax=Marinobacter nauticus TaxID=2743 RepID=UPI003AF40ED3